MTGGAPDGPEYAPTTPRSVPHNRFTSVMSMVCYIAPTANTPPVFGTVFLFSTECASVRCHNYNADGRHPSHVDSYQQSIRPFKAVE